MGVAKHMPGDAPQISLCTTHPYRSLAGNSVAGSRVAMRGARIANKQVSVREGAAAFGGPDSCVPPPWPPANLTSVLFGWLPQPSNSHTPVPISVSSGPFELVSSTCSHLVANELPSTLSIYHITGVQRLRCGHGWKPWAEGHEGPLEVH
jgi:hypothetical protein